MQKNRKSVQEAEELGGALRRRRKELGLTLSSLADILQIDAGQLSRFERAEFKRASRNLQKVAIFLQIPVAKETGESNAVVRQFAELLGRSERHRAAAIALVLALQELR
ncbi:MAG TPA: helix-turn-helix transcriptional regulator [Rhodocyclaceae bacterium]|uniref:helix-turn-helix domain-containing protein n=1 Tax=Zoogloea sp. TaxID=49181 RepID=UPI002CB47601|nr:helix-turn-helix transcriptional regulator [Zoogloea sp.]HMZ77855.1 helix-turn-helix transcriptional regulator [Rhodocyclaceae bacterium]HNH15334.1 helix-turn-helix transcriptional regulator [Zoogloea sp.]